MANFTINSDSIKVSPNYEPLEINFELSSPETNSKQSVRLTDGLGSGGSNPYTFSFPPGITIIQPGAWNVVAFSPDQFRINTIGLFRNTTATTNGDTGTATLFEEDGVTIPTLPVTIPVVTSGATSQYIVGIDNFTTTVSGSVSTIILNVDYIDTSQSITVNKDILLRFTLL